MTPVWGLREHVVPFVMQQIGVSRDFGECQALGVVNSRNELVAGIVFHNWCPETGVIEVSAGATTPKWATRTVLSAAFGYAFDVVECQAVVARIHEDNERARRLWRAFGADEYLIPRLRGRDSAEAVEIVTEEAWSASRFMR